MAGIRREGNMGLINRFIAPHLKSLMANGRLCLQGENHIQLSDFFYIRRSGIVSIGQNTSLRDRVTFRVDEKSSVILGNNVFVNDGCEFNCHESIVVEDGVMFGQNVLLYDHDHDYRRGPQQKRTMFVTAPITIEANAWIGANCVILKGVTIGENSIIAAGSVVTRDVPSNSLFYNARTEMIQDISEYCDEIH